MIERYRLRRSQRLHAADVAATLRARKGRQSGRFRLARRANGLEVARLALVVPKRLAPRAVDRNRVRRVIREVFRLNQQRLRGQDLVVRLTGPLGDRPVDAAEIEALLLAG